MHVKVIEGARNVSGVQGGVVIRRQGRGIREISVRRATASSTDLPRALAEHRPYRGGDPWRCSPPLYYLCGLRKEGPDQGEAPEAPERLGDVRKPPPALATLICDLWTPHRAPAGSAEPELSLRDQPGRVADGSSAQPRSTAAPDADSKLKAAKTDDRGPRKRRRCGSSRCWR